MFVSFVLFIIRRCAVLLKRVPENVRIPESLPVQSALRHDRYSIPYYKQISEKNQERIVNYRRIFGGKAAAASAVHAGGRREWFFLRMRGACSVRCEAFAIAAIAVLREAVWILLRAVRSFYRSWRRRMSGRQMLCDKTGGGIPCAMHTSESRLAGDPAHRGTWDGCFGKIAAFRDVLICTKGVCRNAWFLKNGSEYGILYLCLCCALAAPFCPALNPCFDSDAPQPCRALSDRLRRRSAALPGIRMRAEWNEGVGTAANGKVMG